MVISSFISSILILALGIWAFLRLESSMNLFAEKQLLIEPSKFSYKMWKDMPVTMYQSFTFFNLTNWNQVKSIGQKPRFVEVGPYVYRTIWTKSDVNFLDDERLISFSERKQWIFQPHLSKGYEDDQIWTINTPLMTALALIQNAPVLTRNIVSVILDGLGEGAFIKRNIRSLLFEGYSDLIVSVGPLFDRRFSNFNGKFAYLYNKNDSIDGTWTVSTGTDDLTNLNKITRFQSNIVNMTSHSTGQLPQGLIEVKPECAPAWSLDQATNGQLFAPFNRDVEQYKLRKQLEQLAQSSTTTSRASTIKARSSPQQQTSSSATTNNSNNNNNINDPISRSESSQIPATAPAPKRFFSRSAGSHDYYHHHNHHNHHHHHNHNSPDNLVPNSMNQKLQYQDLATSQTATTTATATTTSAQREAAERAALLRDVGKFIFYPDLCRPIHLLPSKEEVSTENGIKATRYFIDPRVFMNSTQVPTNKCYEMNPRPALANALAATINSVTGANVQVPNLVAGAGSPFAMFGGPPSGHHNIDGSGGSGALGGGGLGGGLFERSNHPSSFLNNALHGFGAGSGGGNQQGDQQMSSSNQAPVSRLGRVRQLFSNIVSQRMSAASPGSLLPSLASVPANLLIGNHFPTAASSRNSPDEPGLLHGGTLARHSASSSSGGPNHDLAAARSQQSLADPLQQGSQAVPSPSGLPHPPPPPPPHPPAPVGGSDRWITQFRFKWPRGVFSIGQCQLGAPIYASLPHFLDADEYYLEQVDGLKPNRSLHEFYIDIESTLHSIPVGAKARLQLNVATPELRFRNIPNAMIPVLWQEVTFEIDKPIASMLFWSFTMSSTIYKLISVALLLGGTFLLVTSFIGGFKQHTRGRGSIETSQQTKTTTRRRNSESSQETGSQQREQQMDGQRSTSWQPHILTSHNGEIRLANPKARIPSYRGGGSSSNSTSSKSSSGTKSHHDHRHHHHHLNHHHQHPDNDILDDIRHGAALNHAFSSCTEFHDRQNSVAAGSGPPSSGANGSPKQPSSRASSHCELVSSLGTQVNGCTGCLLACLRHSPNNKSNQHHMSDHCHLAGGGGGTGSTGSGLVGGSSDNNSLVRQQITTSDIDKATLSSRESNLDSCSSIYTTQQRIRTFK